MIDAIQAEGKFLHECSVPGETRADGVYPGHPNGMQLSADRFLIVYATRGFRGVDDDRSVVYQIRKGSYDGDVIREGLIAGTRDDWDALGDGTPHVRQFGHPVVFGVPKGAVIDGETPQHANHVVIKFRCSARPIDPATGLLIHDRDACDRAARVKSVWWAQARLNRAEDDLNFTVAPSPVVKSGCASGAEAFGDEAAGFNQTFGEPQPLNPQRTEWADCAHASTERGSVIAVCKYAWRPEAKRYDWVASGPASGRHVSEASIVPYRGEWLIAARPKPDVLPPHVAWLRTGDPFAPLPDWTFPDDVTNRAPLTAYMCPDGAVRLLSGDPNAMPGRSTPRNPLFCWDIDPEDGFAASRRHVVVDVRAAGLPLGRPHAEMGKILPHAGGREQTIVFRVRTRYTEDPNHLDRTITAEEKDACGIYRATIRYARDYPGAWRFE